MKRNVAFLVAMCMLVTACGNASAGKDIVLSVKTVAVAYSDNEEIFDTNAVYEFREYDIYENRKAEAEREINVNGEKLTGEYSYSYSDPFTNYDIDVYINEQSGVMFEVEKDTNCVVGCRNEAGIDIQQFSQVSSADERTSLLNAFAEQYIEMDGFESVINTQVITREDGETSSRNEEGFYIPAENEKAYYTVTYFYMVDGIKTFEKLEINIVDDVVESYYYTLPGVFSECGDRLTVDDEVLPESIKSFVDDNISESCKEVHYDIADTYLSVDGSGNYILISFLDMNYKVDGQDKNAVETIVLELE